jgi:hypothetical protein
MGITVQGNHDVSTFYPDDLAATVETLACCIKGNRLAELIGKLVAKFFADMRLEAAHAHATDADADRLVNQCADQIIGLIEGARGKVEA